MERPKRVLQENRLTAAETVLQMIESVPGVAGGGAEMVCLRLCNALRGGDRYQPLLAANPRTWILTQSPCRAIETPARHHRLDLRYACRIARLLRAEQAALLHTHLMGANLHGAIAARLAGIPSVVTVHSREYDLETRLRRLVYRGIAALAGAVVVVSQELREEFLHLGASSRKVRVIENGVPPNTVGEEEAAAVRRVLGLSAGQPVALALGMLRPAKGHGFMLEAFAKVVSVLPNARLLIAGDGPRREDLEALAVQLDIENAVVFLGFRNDTQRLLAAADFLVGASLHEGQNLAMIEAMMAGRPVVATAVGGTPEIVAEGKTGLLAPPADSAALAAAMLELMQDPERRRRLGETAQRNAAQRFSFAVTAQQYQGLYDELLGRRKDL